MVKMCHKKQQIGMFIVKAYAILEPRFFPGRVDQYVAKHVFHSAGRK